MGQRKLCIRSGTQRVGIVGARQTFADVLGEVLDDELDTPFGEDVVILTPVDVSSLLVLDKLFVVAHNARVMLPEGQTAFREAATPFVAIETRKLDQDDS
jgi:hypothetical protein